MKTATIITPVTMKNILFATDFSEAAERAQSYAICLANRFGARLFVVHAKEPANYALPPESWRSANVADTRKIQQLQESLSKSFPYLESKLHVGEGSAWQVVGAVLKENKVDLIILGTRGRTGAGKLLLGSQAEEILRRASCPVLTVGPHSQTTTDEGKVLSEILYATDFSPESQATAPYAVSIALALRAHLNLLHVVEEQKAGELIHPTEVGPSSIRLLSSMIPEDAEFRSEPECLVETGEASGKILEVAERTHAGLIVLGVRSPTNMGVATHLSDGVAHKVILGATCPVLTVRPC